MTPENITAWIDSFSSGWINRDPEAVMSLFSHDDLRYYESALGEPITSWEKVLDLWKVVPTNQDEITFSYTLLSITDTSAIENWTMTRTLLPSGERQKIDGIFQLKFNGRENLCTYFKQWRTTINELKAF